MKILSYFRGLVFGLSIVALLVGVAMLALTSLQKYISPAECFISKYKTSGPDNCTQLWVWTRVLVGSPPAIVGMNYTLPHYACTFSYVADQFIIRHPINTTIKCSSMQCSPKVPHNVYPDYCDLSHSQLLPPIRLGVAISYDLFTVLGSVLTAMGAVGIIGAIIYHRREDNYELIIN